jgi:protein-arginine kinase activator protein McsA
MYREQERWNKREALRYVVPDYVPKGKVAPLVIMSGEQKQPALGKTGKAHRRAMKVQRRMEELNRELEALERAEHYGESEWA